MTTFSFDAQVTAALFDKTGAIFALGDGSVRFESGARSEVHDGAVLCACVHPSGEGIVTGGDDGRLIWHRRADAGVLATSARGQWIDAVDASAENIGTARAHAEQQGLDITYRAATVEQLEAEGAGPFDVVLTMEVIEHVADPEAFIRACSRLVKPGGMMIVATLNRTLKSLALGKVAAEYILRWVPAGTHDWNQFLKPEEIRRMLSAEPLAVSGPFGLVYDPLTDRWSESDDAGINYMMVATRD